MQSSLADLLDAWHDFDLLIGTAAATLIGLMFVAASIGASVYTEKDRAAMEAFISPTVVHFSAGTSGEKLPSVIASLRARVYACAFAQRTVRRR